MEKLIQKGKKLKKIQVTTSIRLPPEAVKNIIDKLDERDDLIHYDYEAKKHETFKLKDDPDSMLQISSRGKIIITVKSPSSYEKLHKALSYAIQMNGYSPHILKPMKAKLYRVEEYEVKSLRDIDSLILAQTILGSRKE